MKKVAVLSAWIVLFCSFIETQCAGQTTGAAGLPREQSEQFQQILSSGDAADFVERATRFWKLRKSWSPEQTSAVRNALATRAQEFVGPERDLASLDSDVVQQVMQFASSTMNDREKQQLRQRVNAAFPMSQDSTFSDLLSRVTLEGGLVTEPLERRHTIRSVTSDWLSNQDLSTMTQSQLNACFRFLCPAIEGYDGFQVTWTGFVTAPRTAAYRFSISPWNVNTQQLEDGELYLSELTVEVNIDGQRVVNAQPADWKPTGAPINLTAGQPVPIRVELTYHYTPNDHHRVCPAQLLWEAPGMSRTVVPTTALTCDESGKVGLRAEYSWQEQSGQDGGPKRTEAVVDPNLDFVWADALTIGAREEQAKRLTNELASRWTRPDGDFVGDIARRPQMVVLLGGNQREGCLQSLVDQPQQLDQISRSSMERFYTATRCGDDELALDVLGTWLTRHAYLAPVMAVDQEHYFDLNRELYHRIAQFIAVEYPQAMDWLEQRYLELPDGGCCLNVANTLSECHLMIGTIPDWIEALDERLADDSIAGDERVDWLIARSVADELSYATANRYYRTREELLAGQGWLDEASLVAESPAARLRVARERIARLATLGRWEAIDEELPSAARSAQDAQVDVSEWNTSLDRLKELAAQEANDEKSEEHDAYVQEFERRRVLASQQGDFEAVRSYDQLISTFKGEGEQ